MKTFAYIGLFMGSLFITLGVFIPLFFPPFIQSWGQNGNYIIGVALVAYGILRLNRAYKVLKNAR